MTSSKEYRPIVDLPNTNVERNFDLVSFACVVIMVMGSIAMMAYLPDRIPIHWNLKGQADGFGSKTTMLLLPMFSVLFFCMFSWVYKIPHKYNYAQKLTPENYEEQYLGSRKLLRIIHAFSQITFVCILGFILNGAFGESQNIPFWFPPLVLIAGVGFPVIYAIRLSKK